MFGSTIATEEVTTSPDFVSLDGSAQQEGIEMESPRAYRSGYAM